MPEVCERWVSGWTGKVISVWATTVWPDGGSWWPFWKLGGDSSLGPRPAVSRSWFFLTWTKEIPESLYRLPSVSGSPLHSARLVLLWMWLLHIIWPKRQSCWVIWRPCDGYLSSLISLLNDFSSHNTCLQTPLPPQSEGLGAEAI